MTYNADISFFFSAPSHGNNQTKHRITAVYKIPDIKNCAIKWTLRNNEATICEHPVANATKIETTIN